MNNLVYKDFKLSIDWFFSLIMPVLMGVLFLIPQWPYLIVFMYFFFISIPNLFSAFTAQNDFGFAIMMPVSKRAMVKGKILTFAIIEILHLLSGAVFAIFHIRLYGIDNFMLDPDFAFFGVALVMYAIFNLVFFPAYFRSAYKFGVPTIAGSTAAVLFAAVVEIFGLINPVFRNYLEGQSPEMRKLQIIILICGAAIFLILNFITYKISAKRFENIDL